MEKIIWDDSFNLFLKELLVEHIVKTDGAFGDYLIDVRTG